MRSRRSLALAIILFSALTSANAAWAAAVVSSNPAVGASLASAPTQVTITTDGPLAQMGNSIEVTDPTGLRVDDGSLQVSGSTALVGIKSLTQTGLYTVAYQLIYADGQNLNNSYTFTLTATGSPTATPTPTPVETLPPLKNSTFLDRLKGGGVGLLLVAIILIVIGSRVAGSRRNR